MEIVLVYIALSIVVIILIIGCFITKTSDLPYLTRRLVVELSMDESLAYRIQSACDNFRQGKPESADIVIYQCAYQGYVTADDLNQIFEYFPGIIQSPAIFIHEHYTGKKSFKVSFDELLDAMGVVR